MALVGVGNLAKDGASGVVKYNMAPILQVTSLVNIPLGTMTGEEWWEYCQYQNNVRTSIAFGVVKSPFDLFHAGSTVMGTAAYISDGSTQLLEDVNQSISSTDNAIIDHLNLDKDSYMQGKAILPTALMVSAGYNGFKSVQAKIQAVIAKGKQASAVQSAATTAEGMGKTVPAKLVQKGKTPVIGKMADLNKPGAINSNEFKVADYLPDLGNPKANWKQNDGILRSVMNEGNPIRDVSPYPMENAGFLGAERNLLQSRGWTYNKGYWYPPT